jgi:hypothetical protein
VSERLTAASSTRRPDYDNPSATPAARGRAPRLSRQEAIGYPLLVFAVHWVVIQLTASIAYRIGISNSHSAPYGQLPPSLDGLASLIVEPLRHWDGLWYTLIANEGYGGTTETARAAFWPLFPWLMDLGNQITGWPPEVIGYIISNVAFAIALILLYRLVIIDFDRPVARRTLWALALFPTALFFTAVYTESLFLVLVVGSLLAARQGNWLAAGLIGALAALTRSYGVLLGLPFLVLLFQQYRFEWRRWFPAVIFAALPLLGPIVFGLHLDQVQGNWRAFVDVQTQWNRYSAMPWETLRCAVETCHRLNGGAITDGADWSWLQTLRDNPGLDTLRDHEWRLAVADSDTLELVTTALFLVLAAIGLWQLPLYQSAYLIPGLMIPLFQPSTVHALMSMPRFGLTLFPLFIVIAILTRPRWLAIPLLVVSTLLLIALTAQFALWYWVS